MKTGASYLRILGFLVLSFLMLEYVVDSGEQMAIEKYPIIWVILGFILFFSIAIELIVAALENILFQSLSDEKQASYLAKAEVKKAKRFSWIKKTYKKSLGSKPIEKEGEIILDHNYDGIKELDNNLPPWWVYGFYATILFAVVYMVRYQVLGDINQIEEYEIAVAEAKLQIAEYKRTAKNLVDVNTVEVLIDAGDLAAGQKIFNENCIACHKADGGGGIGPNLTDANWILGGGIKNVFNTISEGGRDGKGMISWKSDLKPLEMAQVASYVLQFEGKTPAEPKAAEGDIWINPDTPTHNNEIIEDIIILNDSTAVEVSLKK